MKKNHRIGVRVSAELHALLAAAGDLSASTRALTLLGAHAAGYELGSLRDEAASLLAAPLDPPVRGALWGLLQEASAAVGRLPNGRSTAVGQPLNRSSTPSEAISYADDPAAADDPLASLGFEV